MSGPRRNRNDQQRRREGGGQQSQQNQASQTQKQPQDRSSQRQNSQSRHHSSGQNRQAQKSGSQRSQKQNRSQKSNSAQKQHRTQSGRDSSQAKKKGSIFDLKFDATETTDIPTSNRVFRFPVNSPQVKPDDKRYGVLFYETFAEATQQLPFIEQSSKNFDQLNIVIHQEGSMVNTAFNQFGKVFAGEAWWIVHKRREADGWYKTHNQA